MGMERFGIIGFVSGSRVEDFLTYLDQGKVMTTQCNLCSQVYFPPKFDCDRCGKSQMDWIEIKGTGKLETFTTCMYGPAGFEKETPYTLGVVNFSKGIKIFGLLDKRIPYIEVKVGIDLKVVPVKMDDRVFYHFEKA